jgi:hypothetical protein
MQALPSAGLITSPVIICGHPKSGTSLLMTMLDSHPELIVYPEETHYFRRFLPKTQLKGNRKLLDLIESELLHIFHWNTETPHQSQAGFPDRDYSMIRFEAVLDAFLRLMSDRSYDEVSILPTVVLSYGIVAGQINQGSKYWVEKTPYNENYAGQVFRYWPNAKCIHIVRDPRDNYASYIRKHPEWGVDIFARSWFKSLKAGWKNQKSFGRSRYLLLRYEDIVQRPETMIAEIVEFLDIRDLPILRRPTRSGIPWGGNSMFGDTFSSISKKPTGRYQAVLSTNAVARLELLLHPEMNELGYLSETVLTPGMWVKNKLTRLRWSF